MIAIPTYPYDPHSVWNRNQLGALSMSDSLTIGGFALAAYVIYRLMKGGTMKGLIPKF